MACFFCGRITDEDHFCMGCNHHVCDDCDYSPGLRGVHDVYDHQDPDEDWADADDWQDDDEEEDT